MILSIDLYSAKCNTFVLNFFIQFTCTNLDGPQKEEVNFFGVLHKEGFHQKREATALEETMSISVKKPQTHHNLFFNEL